MKKKRKMMDGRVQADVHIRHGWKAAVFNGLSMLFISLLAAACVIPFIFILAGSFSSESAIAVNGYFCRRNLPWTPTGRFFIWGIPFPRRTL